MSGGAVERGALLRRLLLAIGPRDACASAPVALEDDFLRRTTAIGRRKLGCGDGCHAGTAKRGAHYLELPGGGQISSEVVQPAIFDPLQRFLSTGHARQSDADGRQRRAAATHAFSMPGSLKKSPGDSAV